ncbi:CIA30 family protein [Pelagicoccus sp. SDUM812003]|uniref:CIA30 family protein n=1 Tax=Pelagicoccus sp. SDUM812003 TaxID=3041267 RepID=UPI0028105170|nr:CIA30 family protein [Pelagicoccus sp. SDUM812003]MDQ8204044.1 CIA30 family protein [Pelagicoccus sp. SDUM812003]
MKTIARSLLNAAKALLAIAALSSSIIAAETPSLIDDFSDSDKNSFGFPRMYMNDTTTGGSTSTAQKVEDGVLLASGEIAPPRGQPGWASMVLLLSADGTPVDLSAYQGVRLKVKQSQGMLSLSVNSSEVKNYDYHAALVPYQKGDQLQEITIPFSSLKRAWSEQTKLNPQTIQSISLVSVGMQKGPFAYEIDEISFY